MVHPTNLPPGEAAPSLHQAPPPVPQPGILNLVLGQRPSPHRLMENASFENSSLGYRTLVGPATVTGATAAPQEAAGGLSLPLQVFFCLVLLCVLLVALLGNVVVCLMVYQRAAMRSAINILLASLALSDAMLALLNMPFALVTAATTHWVFGEAFCRVSAMFFWLFVTEGVAVLLIISVDRFLIIVQKQDKLSPRRAKLLVGVSWALSLFFSLPLAVGLPLLPTPPRAPQCVFGYAHDPGPRAYVVLVTLVVFFLPFTAMLYTFMGILGTIRHNAVRIHSHGEGVGTGLGTGVGTGLSQASKLGLMSLQRPFRMSVDMSFKTRAFATILILFSVFVVCWAPFVAFSLASTFSGAFYRAENYFRVSTCLLWLCYLKSALNPLIYYWRIKKFRDACLDLAPKHFRLVLPLPGHTKRRIRPSAIYVCGEQRSGE